MKIKTILLFTVVFAGLLPAGDDHRIPHRDRTPAPTPEPATIAVVGVVLGLGLYLKRKKGNQ